MSSEIVDSGASGTTVDPAVSSGAAGTPGATSVAAQPDWRNHLTGDFAPLAAEKSLAEIKGATLEEAIGPLAKSYAATKRMVGNSIQLPKPGPDGTIDPAQERDLWTRLGVPVNIEGYKDVRLDAIEGLGAVNQTLVEAAKPEFLKAGLTPKQGQAMLNLYSQVTSRQRREQADKWVQEQSKLEEKWGLNFDRNVTWAQRVLQQYFPQGFHKFLRDSMLDMHPDMIEGMYEVATRMSEASFIEGEEPTVAENEATEKAITELRTQLAGMNQGTQAWREGNAKLEALYKKRYGTASNAPVMQRP